MKDRVILHSDLNNYFASVECIFQPKLREVPMAVCGSVEARRGVVLAKNELAKRYGIRTGETVYSAQKKCPSLVLCGTHFKEYADYSKRVREIYARFTDKIEAFSIDECFLDVTESDYLFGTGREIAERIRETVKAELSLTVSVGVSFNKVFAKIASDLKKPDAVTEITRENYREILYRLPVSAMLYVGKATEQTLAKAGVHTIGDLAKQSKERMTGLLGKRGALLLSYARGEDDSPVETESRDLKSIGNSLTTPEDLFDREDVKRFLYILAESVAARLRQSGAGKADTVHITVRDSSFRTQGWQKKIAPTCLCDQIAKHAFSLFCERYEGGGVRMLGVSVSGFTGGTEQLSLLSEGEEKKERLESAIDKLRDKYGYRSVQRGIMFEREECADMDLQGERLSGKED